MARSLRSTWKTGRAANRRKSSPFNAVQPAWRRFPRTTAGSPMQPRNLASPKSLSNAGGKYQVSRNGGAYPRWRGDGKELFFISPQEGLVAAQIEVSGEALRPSAPAKLFDLSMNEGTYWDV